MQPLDIIAKFFLIFGQEFVLVPLIIIGFLALSEPPRVYTRGI
jgi:hypothetical protein